MLRRDFLRTAGVTAGASLLPFLRYLPAEAAGRDDTLVVVVGHGINSLDLHRQGTNRPSYQITVNVYDRLVGFGVKELDNGTLAYDSRKIIPEAAESWTVSDDGKSITFKISPKAKFWDGSPVTAHDVKWSFDRAVSLGGFPAVQMKAGSMTDPEQFVVVDDMTFRVDLPRPSKLTLPDLAVPIPFIINSEVAKQHATEKDPWATEYLHKTPLGSGAFKVARWDPGQQFVYERNEDWALGPKPGVKRVILREVPSAAIISRRASSEVPGGTSASTSDWPASAGASLIPSPTNATRPNCSCSAFTSSTISCQVRSSRFGGSRSPRAICCPYGFSR